MANHNKYHNGQFKSNGNNISFNSSSNSQSRDLQNDEIDFKQLFYTLWSGKWIIIGSVLFFGIMAYIVAFLSTPIYQSQGEMLIQDSKGANPFSNSKGIGQVLSSSYGLGASSTLENELQVLQSRKLSQTIADTLMEERFTLDGGQFPVLFKSYPEDSMMTSKDTVAARIRSNIVFNQVDKLSDVVSVTYESLSPFEAGHIVNLAMSSYRDLSTKQNRLSANSAVNFLKKEQSRIKKELDNSEEQLREFMNESKLVQVQPQTEKLIDQMAELEARKQQARANLVATNSAISQYQNQLNKIKPGLAEQYSKSVGPKMSRFQYQLAELETQKERLLVNNPRLRNTQNPPEQLAKLNREIASFQQRIKELTQGLIEQSDQYLGFLGNGEGGIAQNISELNQKLIELEVQQEQFESQIDVITAQLNEQEQFFNNLPDNIVDFAQLKRDVKINEELFVTVSQQYAETALWEQTQFGLGRIVDSGFIPKEPIKPNKTLYVLVGFILGGILSVSYIFVRDAYNQGINGVEQMRKLDEPLLSVIPSMDSYVNDQHNGQATVAVQGKDISTGLITVLDSISPISESFRRLANNLIYSNPDSKMNSFMVTSSGKGEGKTTTISNLGVVLAEAGYSSLIVDTDFRRPNLHNIFGHNKKPGIIEVLFDDINIKEAIHQTVVPGLSILSSGRRPPNASAITQSQSFLNLVKSLEEEYDFVLIDTPPFGIITDASAMIRQTDGVVVIAKFGETTEVQLSQTLEHLHRLNAKITGTVLTAFDHTESKDYYLGSSYYKDVYEDYNEYQEKS
jgi:capsular exopolysaccharide synthesis family protein